MSSIKCKFGFHKYDIYKEEDFLSQRGNVIGKIIISRCVNCGKIHIDKFRVIDNY